jgi:hypothetical protein
MSCASPSVFLAATNDPEIRQDRTALFVPWRRATKHVSPAMMSAWLTRVIKFAYLEADHDCICDKAATAHEVRALATSWAYAAEVPFREILAAASWKSATSFTSHYYRHRGQQIHELRGLGDHVVAGHIVG